MPLDPDNNNPMYLLGRLVALLEGPFPSDQSGDRLTGARLDNILIRPRMALAAVFDQFRGRFDDEDVAELLNRLPDPLPAEPVSVIDRGPYWIGYYQQRSHDAHELGRGHILNPDALRRAGEGLFGESWEGELARALRLSDTARIRSWVSRDPKARRRVPAGVTAEILAMLRQQSAERAALADEIEESIKTPTDRDDDS